MTDLQNFIMMVANSENEETFSKEWSNKDWCVKTRGVTIYFDKDGKYKYLTSDR